MSSRVDEIAISLVNDDHRLEIPMDPVAFARRCVEAGAKMKCVSYFTPTCVYLRDGTKVIVNRSGKMEVVPQEIIKLLAPTGQQAEGRPFVEPPHRCHTCGSEKHKACD